MSGADKEEWYYLSAVEEHTIVLVVVLVLVVSADAELRNEQLSWCCSTAIVL